MVSCRIALGMLRKGRGGLYKAQIKEGRRKRKAKRREVTVDYISTIDCIQYVNQVYGQEFSTVT